MMKKRVKNNTIDGLAFGLRLVFLLVCVFMFAVYGYSQFVGEQPFGKAEPDIDTEVKYDEGLILFKFDLDESHHITDLKNNFFKIELEKNDYLEMIDAVFPRGVAYADEMVFKGQFAVKVYVRSLKDITDPVKLKFKVSYQICQEKPQEVCFRPEGKELEVTIKQTFKEVKMIGKGKEEEGKEDRGKKEGESYSQWIERMIKQELEKKSFFLFLVVFLAGLLTSLTPCVYPVIPIVMGYIGTRSGKKKLKGFYLSIFFVLGLAFVYSVLGVIAAATGTMMGVSFQNPVVVIVISAIFIVMGLSLAGFFEIKVPSSLSSKVQSGYKSEIFGSLLVGGISGIIAAPCVGPVLIALLSWISQTGNILLGFWLTFTFSMGMGIIFLVVGTFSGLVSTLPKGGKWMNYIKYFFALVLLGGGIYFLGTIAAPWVSLLLWGIFLVSAGIFMGLFKPLEEDEVKSKTFKVIVVLIFLIGALLFVKAVEMKYFPAKYAGESTERIHLPWISSLEEGKSLARAENKLMMIDTYADWCVACKELEKYTFKTPEVSGRLKDFVLVKLDFTKRNEANEELRKSLKVIGMPTVIFFKPDGTEIHRFYGFKKKDEFLKIIDSL
ncbi:MAG: protein-disulfide reductase DsbD [Candidatus Aminicenantes bacterium]|nr:MAG: protein-disulfide reductase DsbD [Candidatus Aminicenantes bacterium]